MSDHDTHPPEADDKIRVRMRTFAQQVRDRTDTEAALQRLPARPRASTVRFLAIAACLIAVVAVTAVVVERSSVDTIAPSQSPTTASSTTTTLTGGPKLVAKGEIAYDVGFGSSLARRTVVVDAVELNNKVTGEFRMDDVTVTLQCAKSLTWTASDGTPYTDLILGGVVTDDPAGDGLPVHDGAVVAVGDPLALIVRKSGPMSVRVSPWTNDGAGCTDLVESVPFNLDGGYFSENRLVGTIQTG